MIRKYYLILLLVMGCVKPSSNINSNDLEKWNIGNLTYISSVCEDFDKSLSKIILSKALKDNLRYKLINKLDFNQPVEIEFYEVYENKQPNIIMVRIEKKVFEFIRIDGEINLKRNQESTSKKWEEEIKLMGENKNSFCNEIKLPDPAISIYSKIRIYNNKVKLLETQVW